MLLEMGIDIQQATVILQAGMQQQPQPQQYNSPLLTDDGVSSAGVAFPGLTQHLIREACLVAANAGESSPLPTCVCLMILEFALSHRCCLATRLAWHAWWTASQS
jgi:hypothetical protein